MQLISPPFGNGSDGVWSTSGNATDAPIDASCSGWATGTSLLATNVSFAAGQLILIHQSRGTGVGQWELNKISSYVAGTITTLLPLAYDYTDSGASQAQVQVVKQYSSATIGHVITAKAWDGNVGGILSFACNGTTTITGSLTATGKGYVDGGVSNGDTGQGTQGEGTVAAGGTRGTSANGSGGGGGLVEEENSDAKNASGGGGGGNGAAGSTALTQAGSNDPQRPAQAGGGGGSTSGAADLTTITFGGAGGTGGASQGTHDGSGDTGGDGGGIIIIFPKIITVSGSIVANGNDGSSIYLHGGGGGGAGGSVLIKSQSATLGSSLITATAGTGSAQNVYGGGGGNGGTGRVRIEYQTLSGTTSPSASTVYKYFGADHASMI